MVNFLLDKGADKTLKNTDGQTPVQIADRHKKMEVVNALAHHTGPVIASKKPVQIIAEGPAPSQTNPPEGTAHDNPKPKDEQ